MIGCHPSHLLAESEEDKSNEEHEGARKLQIRDAKTESDSCQQLVGEKADSEYPDIGDDCQQKADFSGKVIVRVDTVRNRYDQSSNEAQEVELDS